jgi:DNA-binding transcriptional MocR family regulator
MKLYQVAAQELERMIRGGTLHVGDKLPSVRMFCHARGVSPSTVLRAYSMLELAGLIQARPRSGYFVSARPKPPVPRSSMPKARSTRVAVSDLVFDTLEASRNREVIPLGSAFPGPAQFPWKKLARYLGRSARRMDSTTVIRGAPKWTVRFDVSETY